ncbi:MAG: hypothetical protein OXI43_11230 [Candidatus Poribacteria bacterium]|nr:hypothetical protein [Candidatus Poribacteria bacterium]
MMKYFRAFSMLLLVFCFSSTLVGNESTTPYFPHKLGSFWVYEDNEGNEMTRYAAGKKEIEGVTYFSFNYEPKFENWTFSEYFVHPTLYHVGEEWIAILANGEAEKVVQDMAMQRFREHVISAAEQLTSNVEIQENGSDDQPPADSNVSISLKLNIDKVEGDEFLYVFPISPTFNEEWTAIQLNAKVSLKYELKGKPSELSKLGELPDTKFNFNLVEIGKVVGTETVETEAGTFEDCLKIKYHTKTTLAFSAAEEGGQNLIGDYITTLWLAPNVGIVKFSSGHEQSGKVKSMELTRYEIKTDNPINK